MKIKHFRSKGVETEGDEAVYNGSDRVQPDDFTVDQIRSGTGQMGFDHVTHSNL